MKTGILVLAAGNSSRLGREKQLLPFEGKTLLSHALDAALGTAFRPVVAVLGASADRIRAAHTYREIQWVTNLEWELGMSSSIGAGVSRLLSIDNALQHIIIMVCDQVHLTSASLSSLQFRYLQSKKGIIASSYNGVHGTPVMFQRKYFSELKYLNGNSGAKTLVHRYHSDVELVEFDLGEVDVDTELDYENLIRKSGRL